MSKENYEGIKYQLHITDDMAPNHELLRDLKKHCAWFSAEGFAPCFEGGSAGNLSFRIAPGSDAFIITCASTALRENMPNEAFALVHHIALEENIVSAISVNPPSSEALMHGALYRARPDINAIFHGHDELFLSPESAQLFPVTQKEQAYGTPELVSEILRIPQKPNFIILKNHGFVALGKTMQDAADIIQDLKQKLRKE